jgi:hypothetical protein
VLGHIYVQQLEQDRSFAVLKSPEEKEASSVMAEKKRQHYVPQFYLRLFAIAGSERHFRLYNFERNHYVPQARIEDQAAESYFYKSRDLEDALGLFEGRAASVVRAIIREKAVPKNGSEAFFDLLLFLLLQHSRTRYAVDEHDETWAKMKEVVLGGKPESLLPPQLRGEIDNVPQFLMRVTVDNAQAAADLHAKLIINTTPDPFITSDNPAVFYNQFLMYKGVSGGRTGIGCRGLQVFFPLNDQMLLHLFDKDVYSVGGNRLSKKLVEDKRPKDVFQLNQLQAVNSNWNLYFSDRASESYIQKLMKSSGKYRRCDKAIVEEFPSVSPGWLPQPSLLVHHRAEIELPLDLSFVRITHAGEQYDPRGKSVHMRDQSLLAVQEARMIRHLRERLVGRELAGIYAKNPGA